MLRHSSVDSYFTSRAAILVSISSGESRCVAGFRLQVLPLSAGIDESKKDRSIVVETDRRETSLCSSTNIIICTDHLALKEIFLNNFER